MAEASLVKPPIAKPPIAKPPKHIALLSDLHGEHGIHRPLRAIRSLAHEAKILVLAGDVGNWSLMGEPMDGGESLMGKPKDQEDSLTELLRKVSEERLFKKTLMVAGNHDYYFCGATESLAKDEDPASFFDYADECLEDLVGELGTVFLQKKVVAVGPYAIGGATLWCPAAKASPTEASFMCDYAAIQGFTPAICQAVYENHKAWLTSVLTDEATAPDLVFSHHPPLDHPSLRHRCYTHASAPLFHGDLVDLFDNPAFVAPSFWGFGHTHIRKAALLGFPQTLLMANALGSGCTDHLWDLPSLEVPLL